MFTVTIVTRISRPPSIAVSYEFRHPLLCDVLIHPVCIIGKAYWTASGRRAMVQYSVIGPLVITISHEATI